MIENRTTLNKDDLRYLIRETIRRQPIMRIRQVLGVLVGVFSLCFSGFLTLLIAKDSRYFTGLFIISAMALLIMGLFLVIRSLLLEQISMEKSLKMPEFKAERHYLLTEESAGVTKIVDGSEQQEKITYDKALGYVLQNGAVYILFRYGSKPVYFMALHDDSYTQGDRAALVALLEKHSVKPLS